MGAYGENDEPLSTSLASLVFLSITQRKVSPLWYQCLCCPPQSSFCCLSISFPFSVFLTVSYSLVLETCSCKFFPLLPVVVPPSLRCLHHIYQQICDSQVYFSHLLVWECKYAPPLRVLKCMFNTKRQGCKQRYFLRHSCCMKHNCY